MSHPFTSPDFWRRVNQHGTVPAACPELGPCWLWTGGQKSGGYGALMVHGTMRTAPQVSWWLHTGEWPPDRASLRWLLHRCDVRLCCNPAHLYLGSPADNARDRDVRGRNGRAKLTAANVCAIRQRVAGGETQVAMALEYGVHSSMVSYIVRGVHWRAQLEGS